MEREKLCTLHARMVRSLVATKESVQEASVQENWRRHCGCLRTSEKLKEILKAFPAPPPPSPIFEQNEIKCVGFCGAVRKEVDRRTQHFPEQRKISDGDPKLTDSKLRRRSWEILGDLVQLLQLSVTATALALYYVIYCYMQLIYYTLRSALYFHNADGPMKITIGVVTITSVIVGFNLLIRMEKLIGIYLF